jgi:hypothetical protein
MFELKKDDVGVTVQLRILYVEPRSSWFMLVTWEYIVQIVISRKLRWTGMLVRWSGIVNRYGMLVKERHLKER